MPNSTASPKYEKFTKLLIAHRLEQVMTQTQLAARLDRPQSFISKYENGERRIDLVKFLDIAAVLEIDPIEFIKELLAET